MSKLEEEWRPIPGLNGYQASSLGRVRSLDRYLRLRRSPNGYWVVTVSGKNRTVNWVVCSAFHGPPPTESHQSAHWDGDKDNNTPGNLRWATPKENEADKVRHGTNPIGERNGAATLAEKQIEPIFDAYLEGGAPLVVERFGLDRCGMHLILRRDQWRHVQVPAEKVVAVAAKAAAIALETRRRNMINAPRPKGPDHPRAKLSEALVREARSVYASRANLKQWSRERSLDYRTVYHAATRRTWRYLDA